ncbi:LysR family transcriptional regulator [Virgibacillus dakarensis]|uniref:LysR family transcriptional regulator n=1 Tax=Lentibacillus populi TaxID=1827502 RepID=A0A9W5TUC6_9BACI|nr:MULTISPECIES: LysR family transcriptional regulator [Bacillaceae]MBT2216902.1 LysR family transcriptional regulator [Virgibacillus dakarensis]MTW85308.1 LysR family transcriptional regulator [Virgibacillus dakarensis]GGB29635.1 LysR family transcriptional regulator [Lentibacillus populi]
MKIDDYALLLKLHEIGTIRGTAKAILISQPAVTQRLKYIEEYFGQTIFIRTSKSLVLTPAGEIIIEHAKGVMEREEVLKNQLAQSSDDVQGTISIACSSLISQRFLPAILAQFTRAYPKVAIDLVTGLSEDIKRDHKNYHVCIIRGETFKESTCKRLFDDPLYIFDTEPFPDNKLKERPLISFKSDDSMHESVDNWLYYHQDQIKPLKTITVDQIETCKQFMKEGLGMAVLPESVSDKMMDEYPHIPLKLNGESVTRDTWICYQEGVRKLPQVDRFIQTIIDKTFL